MRGLKRDAPFTSVLQSVATSGSAGGGSAPGRAGGRGGREKRWRARPCSDQLRDAWGVRRGSQGERVVKHNVVGG